MPSRPSKTPSVRSSTEPSQPGERKAKAQARPQSLAISSPSGPAVASTALPPGYREFLRDLKARISRAQLRAAQAANRTLLALYFSIGHDIVVRQDREGWGSAVIERLARDLKAAFPGAAGWSASNLWRMRAFYLAYRPEHEVLAQAVRELELAEFLPPSVAEIPWGHHVVLLERVKDPAQRFWYAHAALEHGWSRGILYLQIDVRVYERQVKASKLTNFHARLPKPQSDLAEETLKDPYLFDFLTLSPKAHEREIEQSLVQHITRFLIELGAGFSFVGRQVHLQVGESDFYIDLLFYHLKLRCFVVIELKGGSFKPEHVGQLNFYLNAVDDKLKHPTDSPSIGLILCRDKNRTVAEYALRGIAKPMGVAEWQTQLVESLPEELRGSLPTVDEIEAELSTLQCEQPAEPASIMG